MMVVDALVPNRCQCINHHADLRVTTVYYAHISNLNIMLQTLTHLPIFADDVFRCIFMIYQVSHFVYDACIPGIVCIWFTHFNVSVLVWYWLFNPYPLGLLHCSWWMIWSLHWSNLEDIGKINCMNLTPTDILIIIEHSTVKPCAYSMFFFFFAYSVVHTVWTVGWFQWLTHWPLGNLKCDSKNVIFNLVLLIGIFRSSHGNALQWMPQGLTDDMSTLVQVMACCRQATSHYLSQCWLSSSSPYGVARPQWVNLQLVEYIILAREDLYI